ncbi:IMPACT family protein [Planctomycetota bacterium]
MSESTPSPCLVPMNAGQAELGVKKSTFLAQVHPWQDMDKVKACVQALRKEHFKARHVAWACMVGVGGQQLHRYSDDGEPSGTAGRPILEMLDKQNRTNVLITVVRYFGGIKLGTGGLAKAYTEAAKAAIEATAWEPLLTKLDFELITGYEQWPAVEPTLHQQGVEILDTAFASDVTVQARVVEADYHALEKTLVNFCHGRLQIRLL